MHFSGRANESCLGEHTQLTQSQYRWRWWQGNFYYYYKKCAAGSQSAATLTPQEMSQGGEDRGNELILTSSLELWTTTLPNISPKGSKSKAGQIGVTVGK